jgi:F420-non-reducing hydrogenase iron-sulfur subunit
MSEMTGEFEPKILGFLCNWCSYAGADLAGVSRNQYPPNIRVIRVMCSGRVDPIFVVNALEKGIDGVLILGCHLGDCHYLEGNYEAKTKYEMLSHLLTFCQLEKRIALDWVSAAEGTYFAEIVSKFTQQIKSLGPSPLNQINKINQTELHLKLAAIRGVVLESRVRKLIGRERALISKKNVYDEVIDPDNFNQILHTTLEQEFIRQLIYVHLKDTPSSAKKMAQLLGYTPQQIFESFLILRQRGVIDLDSIDNISPIYKAISTGD